MDRMDISLFISELLFRNDCVIVPGFGGFVAHYAPAKIHPVNHSFSPPSKNILFNSKLVRDDGLLIDHIAEKQRISYGEAKKLVEDFARRVMSRLSSGEVALFKNIGNLQQDSMGKILFTPDDSVNYLDEAFGLPEFVSPPIRRQAAQKRLEAKYIDRKPVPSVERSGRQRVWAYAATVPVVLFLAWFIFFGNFRITNTQQSGVLTISDTEHSKSPVRENNSGRTEAVTPPLESLDLSDPGASNDKIGEALPEDKKEIPLILKKYYIIGGSFGVELNADKLVAVLRKKGYAAERAGLSPSGLHMVSYFSTEDKSEALVNLEIIRKQDNPAAWLIRK